DRSGDDLSAPLYGRGHCRAPWRSHAAAPRSGQSRQRRATVERRRHHREIPFKRGARHRSSKGAGHRDIAAFARSSDRRRRPRRSAHRRIRSMALDAVTRQASPPDDEAENVILASIDRFLARDVAPYAQKLEHEDIYPEEIVARMKE